MPSLGPIPWTPSFPQNCNFWSGARCLPILPSALSEIICSLSKSPPRLLGARRAGTVTYFYARRGGESYCGCCGTGEGACSQQHARNGLLRATHCAEMETRAAVVLRRLLPSQCLLTFYSAQLVIDNNQIGDSGAAMLAKALEANSKLEAVC